MIRGRRGSQRGVALIALLAVIALGATWYLTSRLHAESGLMTAVVRQRNAQVLDQAKQALIGYVANDAADAAEQNPGRLPCPEAPGSFDNPSTEGTAAGNCTLPAVGRFPWKTLGLDKLVDASGEPLWYVVAPGWAYSGANLTINSNCTSASSGLTCATSQLTVDGVPNSAIALIISPGPAFSVQAAPNCAAINQTRPTTGTPSPSNYLECQNAVGSTFVTTGPSGSFNDQVLKVTAADVMPAIEAAIADRIQRQIVPALQTVYAGAVWGLGASGRKYPFPAGTIYLPNTVPFANPSSSQMLGTSATCSGSLCQGLLPMVYMETSPGSGVPCTAGASAPRCNPTLTSWSAPSMSGASVYSPSCSISGVNINCTYYYQCFLFGCGAGSVAFSLSATASNVGNALRALIPQATLDALAMTNVSTAGRSLAGVLNSSGSAGITLSGTANYPGGGGWVSNALCGISGFLGLFFGCQQATISVPTALLQDHALLDPNNATYGWFVRNGWHELAYYAVAQGYAPSGATSCVTGTDATGTGASCTGGTCLAVANVASPYPVCAQRSILVLAGQGINGDARPSSVLSDYLEFGNNTASFESHSVTSAPSGTLYADTGAANAYSVSANVVAGRPLRFQAGNANTGASTLNTLSTGALSVLNTDGSTLTAGEIQAKAAVEVVYNGTNFVLSRRPFNDRIVVVDSN